MISKEEFEFALEELRASVESEFETRTTRLNNNHWWTDHANTIRAYVDQLEKDALYNLMPKPDELITPEECKRRCRASAEVVYYGSDFIVTEPHRFDDWYKMSYEDDE